MPNFPGVLFHVLSEGFADPPSLFDAADAPRTLLTQKKSRPQVSCAGLGCSASMSSAAS